MTDPFPQLVSALVPFENDKYSETNRWANGYSDCSSFVGKGLKSLSIDPGLSTTLTYLGSSQWYTIPKSEAGAGDIAVNAQHMSVLTSATTAVGQQNPTRNVVHGPLDEIMYGTGPYVIKRYKDAANVSSTTPASYNVTPAGLTELFAFPEGVINFFAKITSGEYVMRILLTIAGGIFIGLGIYGMAK